MLLSIGETERLEPQLDVSPNNTKTLVSTSKVVVQISLTSDGAELP